MAARYSAADVRPKHTVYGKVQFSTPYRSYKSLNTNMENYSGDTIGQLVL
jgi:hypothetical protein